MNHPDGVRKGAVKKLSPVLSEKPMEYYDKSEHQKLGVLKWNEHQDEKYRSLIIDMDCNHVFKS
ncbi:MAG: hypothetical protein ACFFD4_32200 [Candidatus Odinarchaeota archaeon]